MGVIIFLTMAYVIFCIPVGIIRGLLVAFFLTKPYFFKILVHIVLNIVCYILLFSGIFFLPGMDHINIYNYQYVNVCLIFLIFLLMLFLDCGVSRIIPGIKIAFNTRTFVCTCLYWSCVILPLMFAQNTPDGVTVVNKNTPYPKGIAVIINRNGVTLQAKSYQTIAEVKQEAMKQMIPISWETTTYDKECYIAPNPYGGLVYFPEGKRQRLDLNFQTLFYRWGYPQFHYMKKFNVILLNMKSEGYIFDCSNQKLYAIPSGEIVGMEAKTAEII